MKRIGKSDYGWSVRGKDLPDMAENIGILAAAYAKQGETLMAQGFAKIAARCYLDYTDADTRSQLERPNDLHYAKPEAKTPLCGRTLTPAGERTRTTPALIRVTCAQCRDHRDFPMQAPRDRRREAF